MTRAFFIDGGVYTNTLTSSPVRPERGRCAQHIASRSRPALVDAHAMREASGALRMRLKLAGKHVLELPLHRDRVEASRHEIELISPVVP
jgi:hypothetical protein